MYGTHSDVSEVKAAEEALRESEAKLSTLNRSLEQRVDDRTAELRSVIEALTEANEAKTRFLRAMSHELRTPLNSVIGFSSVLLEGTPGELNDEQMRQLSMVNNSGRHLLTLVNEILDLSRIEAGRVEMSVEEIDVAGLVAEAVESVRPVATEKGLALEVELPDRPPVLRSDRGKVLQITLNLMDNAVKFTSKGSVTLRVEHSSEQAIRFVVSDTGPGIAEGERRRIFAEFERASDHDPRVGGTGLGLAISRGLAESLGGTVEVTSEVGKGSMFILTLPTRRD
jgi:signal transduction histidine kinase